MENGRAAATRTNSQSPVRGGLVIVHRGTLMYEALPPQLRGKPPARRRRPELLERDDVGVPALDLLGDLLDPSAAARADVPRDDAHD